MDSTRTSPDTARWGRRSCERSRPTCVGLPFSEARSNSLRRARDRCLSRKAQMEPPSSGARGPRGAGAYSRIRRRPRGRPRHPLRHPAFPRPSSRGPRSSRVLPRGRPGPCRALARPVVFPCPCAGLLTSLLPGAWLLDALELRCITPTRGEVVRPAEWFERTLGPVGAVALLAGFVTLLHTSGYEYGQALFLLGLWAVRIFPPVLASVCVYRLVVEPRVLPGLEAWAAGPGVEPGRSFAEVLPELAAVPAPAAP